MTSPSIRKTDQKTRVVLLHGAGVTSWMWQDLLQGLPEVDALTPDLPVFQKDFTIEQAAHQTLNHLQHRFGHEKVHVVGHSLGGCVALKMLELAPERFLSAMVIGATVLDMGGMKHLFPLMAWTLPLNQTPLMLNLAARAMNIPDHHKAMFVQDQKSMTRSALKQVMQEASGFRPSETLKTCPVPVLALVGSKEAPVNRRSAEAILQHFPQATGAEIQGGHHAWFAQKPEVFRQVMQMWTRNLQLPANPHLKPLTASATSVQRVRNEFI